MSSSSPPPQLRLNGDTTTIADRRSRSSSAELREPLVFVPQRQRNAVSRREDDTDRWGIDEIDSKEEHRLLLRDPIVRSTVLSRLDTFRRNREFCDVVLFVRERELLAHRVVLAAISPALYDMFLNEESSADSNARKPSVETLKPPPVGSNIAYYEFNQGDLESFEALIDFAYTGLLSISSLKIADLYKTAFALKIDGVAEACARHLADHLSTVNCIGIRRHANFHNDSALVNRVDSFIAENVEQIVAESVDFTKLPCIQTRIIAPNRSERIQPDFADSLILRTLSYFQKYPKISDRVDQQIEAITQKSHLLFMEIDKSLSDCSQLDDHSFVGSCTVVQDYKKAKMQRASKIAGHNSEHIGTQNVQHHVTGALPVKINASRVPNAKYASNESLNSMSSSATDVEEEIESKVIAICQTSPDFWIALTVLYKRLVVFSVHISDDEDIGVSSESSASTPPPHENNNRNNGNGIDAKQPADLPPMESVLAKLANSTSLIRQPIAPMQTARCSFGAGFLQSKIVVCGGYDRGECLRTVEEYDVLSGEWHKLAPMSNERGRFDATVAGGRLYAVGGSNGNNDLSSAEAYDPRSQRWESIAPITMPRSHNGCATLDGYVYCIGGQSDQNLLRECERYDINANRWEVIAPMQSGRYNAGCIAWRNLIVCVGGSGRWACLETVEAFDPSTGAWKPLMKLGTPRRGCAVAVVRDSLYVIGGHDGTQSLCTVEVLDHPNGRWRAGPSLLQARGNAHAVVTAANAIYVIGGYSGTHFLPTVEILETESVGWRNYIQKRLSPSATLNEDDEEAAPEITPRATDF